MVKVPPFKIPKLFQITLTYNQLRIKKTLLSSKASPPFEKKLIKNLLKTYAYFILLLK